MSGRRVEARLNDARVLSAARGVFADFGVSASVALVAERAGVGVGSLYRRYPTKDVLLRDACLAGLDVGAEVLEKAASEVDTWAALRRVLREAVEARVERFVRLSEGLGIHDGIADARARVDHASHRLVLRARDAGMRGGVTGGDLLRLVGMLSTVEPEHLERYLTLVLDGLRAPEALSGIC